MKGWRDVSESDLAKLMNRSATPTHAQSKYRNVRTVADGITFDSKREAEHWLLLKAREQQGEIIELKRQVRYPLYAPVHYAVNSRPHDPMMLAEVGAYIADFSYREKDGRRMVVDAKGHRTQMYRLKAKWLALQDGITILEV